MSMSSRWFDPHRAPFFFTVLLTSSLFGAVWCPNRVPLGLWIRARYYTAERRIIYLARIYTHRALLPLPQQLLLLVIVCRMAKSGAGSLNLIPSRVFFPFFQTRFFLCMYPWQHCCRICRLDLPTLLCNYEHARQGGRQPAVAKPPLQFIEIRLIKLCVTCVRVKVKQQQPMDRVRIKPPRPVGKRTMAEVVHVVDKRLVCEGCERVRMGRVFPINALARYQRSPGYI